jgi:hypothetical protein
VTLPGYTATFYLVEETAGLVQQGIECRFLTLTYSYSMDNQHCWMQEDKTMNVTILTLLEILHYAIMRNIYLRFTTLIWMLHLKSTLLHHFYSKISLNVIVVCTRVNIKTSGSLWNIRLQLYNESFGQHCIFGYHTQCLSHCCHKLQICTLCKNKYYKKLHNNANYSLLPDQSDQLCTDSNILLHINYLKINSTLIYMWGKTSQIFAIFILKKTS